MERYRYQYETDERGVKTAVRSVPAEGQRIYKCTGHYDPRKKPNTYYFYAESRSVARRRFCQILGWPPQTVTLVSDPHEIEAILTNISTFPI